MNIIICVCLAIIAKINPIKNKELFFFKKLNINKFIETKKHISLSIKGLEIKYLAK